MAELFQLCKQCLISINFPLGKKPRYDQVKYVSVSSTEDNLILQRIIDKSLAYGVGEPFLITADGNRYSIEILRKYRQRRKPVWILSQAFAHYDGLRKDLVPVYVRYVKIIFM